MAQVRLYDLSKLNLYRTNEKNVCKVYIMFKRDLYKLMKFDKISTFTLNFTRLIIKYYKSNG